MGWEPGGAGYLGRGVHAASEPHSGRRLASTCLGAAMAGDDLKIFKVLKDGTFGSIKMIKQE